MVWENKEKGLQIFISDGRIQCDGLSEKNLGDLGNNTEEEELNIINQLLSRANLTGTSVKKSISNMTEGYDYYDTEVMLNGIPTGGLSQYHYQGSAGFGLKPEDCYFKIPIPLQVKEKETVTMLSMEEIMKSVEQYVKEGKIVCQAEGENAHIEYAQGSGTKKVNDLGQEYRKTAMEAKTPCTDILVYIGNPAANPYANTSPLQTAPFYEGNEVGGTDQNPFGPKPGFGAK